MATTKICYWPNGDEANKNIPCTNTTIDDDTYCCYANHYCFTNGLCLDNSGMTTYRGGCTDRTFKSPSCTKYCTKFGTISGVWACNSNGQFACERKDCGNSSQEFSIPAGFLMPGQAVSSALALSSSDAPLATVTVTVTTNPTTTSTSCSTPRGTTAAVGAGIGVPLLLGMLAAIAFLVRERRRFKAAVSPSTISSALHSTRQQWNSQGYQQTSHIGTEGNIGSRQTPQELPHNPL